MVGNDGTWLQTLVLAIMECSEDGWMNSKCVSGYEGFLELSQKLSDSFPNQRFGPWGMYVFLSKFREVVVFHVSQRLEPY